MAIQQGKSQLRRTNIGPSSAIQALMVKIEWSSSRVIRIEARKNFTLQAHTIQVKKGDYKVLADAPVNIQAGMVMYFVASEEYPSWYYLCMYNEVRGHFNCSCPSGRMRHQCDHQQHALTFVGNRYSRRVEIEHAVMPEWELHIEDELRQAKQERQYEHLASAPLHVEEASVEYSRVA